MKIHSNCKKLDFGFNKPQQYETVLDYLSKRDSTLDKTTVQTKECM
jgi:hypothetical protein